MNQNMTKEIMRIAAMGTTMAGINVVRLFEEELLVADVDVEVAEAADEALVVESVA